MNLFFMLTTVILMLIVLFLLSENNRKYSDAVGHAVTTIARTSRAIANELATYDAATSQAIATGLPMTQTRAVFPSASTPPYDPTLYAERRTLGEIMTSAGVNEYPIMMQTEQALIANTPTPQPMITP